MVSEIGPDGTLIYKCELCNTYFRTKQERTKHSARIHPKRVTCDICDKTFSSTYYLNNHRQHVHAGQRRKTSKIYCAKCGRSFEFEQLFTVFAAHTHLLHRRYFQLNLFHLKYTWTIMRNRSADSRPVTNAAFVQNHSAIAIH